MRAQGNERQKKEKATELGANDVKPNAKDLQERETLESASGVHAALKATMFG